MPIRTDSPVRLILNLILVRHGYPPAIIYKRDRARYLRAAADRGRLRATRGSDGQWRTSRKWVEEYLASRYRRAETSTGTD